MDEYRFTVSDSYQLSEREIKELASNAAREEAIERNWSWFKLEQIGEDSEPAERIYHYRAIGNR